MGIWSPIMVRYRTLRSEGAMRDRAGKPPRWEWVAMDVSIPFRAGEVPHAAETMRTLDLTDEAGDAIAQAMAAVDARRRLVTVRELRYDANRVTEAAARRALERFLAAGAAAAADEAAG